MGESSEKNKENRKFVSNEFGIKLKQIKFFFSKTII